MSIERRNPLPVGRYWLDVPAAKVIEFDGYLQGNKERVHVEHTEGDDVTFYIFTVTEPVPWFATNFGFPTIAGANVKSKADAVQSPDLPPSAADTAQGLLSEAHSLVTLATVGLGIIIGLKLLEALSSKKAK